jgi:hypothetical protein
LIVDFFNWDLEAHGERWRMSVSMLPTALQDDPRR